MDTEPDPRGTDDAILARLAAMPRAEPALALDGVLGCVGDRLEEDDGWLDPGGGLGVVAHGHGATGGQGRPAAKLAVWSVVGELSCHPDLPPEDRLRRGLARAELAVRRLSANWPEGLLRPFASLAAVLLDGRTALVAHIGSCGVARLDGERIVPITRAHTLGAELPEVPEALAGVVTRALGMGAEPSIQRIAVAAGEGLLSSTKAWPAVLAEGTFVAARVAERATHPLARGSGRPPRPSWLFGPGQPLADPPPRYAEGTAGHGPDERWFSEVLAGVMGDEG